MTEVYVVERHAYSGYLNGGSYINTHDHEVVAVYASKDDAKRHARRKNHTWKAVEFHGGTP